MLYPASFIPVIYPKLVLFLTPLQWNGGNAIPKHAGPEAKGNNPTAALTILSARNPFKGNFNHWQVSRKKAG